MLVSGKSFNFTKVTGKKQGYRSTRHLSSEQMRIVTVKIWFETQET